MDTSSTIGPRSPARRRMRPAITAIAPIIPAAMSMAGKPTFTGGASGSSPCSHIMPVAACMTWS